MKKIIADKTYNLVSMNLESSDGKIDYVYLLVKEDKYEALETACREGAAINTDDYGKILLTGEGEAPSDIHKQVISLFVDFVEKRKEELKQ